MLNLFKSVNGDKNNEINDILEEITAQEWGIKLSKTFSILFTWVNILDMSDYQRNTILLHYVFISYI